MDFGGQVAAPIGGTQYVATIGLQFHQDRLAAILVEWPVRTFSNVDSWRHATNALHRQLLDTYDSSLIEHNYVTLQTSGNGLFTLKDTNGNRLRMIAADYRIRLAYLLASYATAVDAAPTPRGNY